ncbi:MAG: hypothetical protein ACRDRZ_12815, partial [Pseudonocardiaceae bacterium]
GLTCALAGYPATGCAETVADAAAPKTEEPVGVALPAAAQDSADEVGADKTNADTSDSESADDDDRGVPVGLVIVGVVVLLLAGIGVLLARKRA